MKKIVFYICLMFAGIAGTYGQCTINPINASGCSGVSKAISAQTLSSANVTEHRWYTSASGGSPISGISQNTAPGSGYYISTLTKTFNASETYYVAPVCNSVESSTRTAVTFTLTTAANIAIQSSPSAPEHCPGDNVTLTAQNGSSYQWRLNSPTSTILSTATTYSPTVSGTYYLTGINSCGQTQTKTIAITFSAPSTPSIQSTSQVCGSTTLVINPPADETWYWQTSPGNTDTSDFVTSKVLTSGSVIYLKSKTNFTNCWSDAITVNYSVDLIPGSASGTGQSRCGPGTLTLPVTPGSNANTIRWYMAATGGSSVHTGTSYTTPSLSATTTYYAESYNSTTQCVATSRTPVVATVNPVPGTAGGANQSRCGTGTLTLSATLGTNANTIRWYTTLTGGSPVHTGLSYTTPSISTTTFYYAESYNSTSGCVTGTRKAVQAEVTMAPTWYLDADGDLYAISTTTACSSPGTGYTATVLPLGDCNDSNAAINPDTIWYADTDGDGLGDPNAATPPRCDPPTDTTYVLNNTDQCPDISSVSNNCTLALSTDPQQHNYVYTIAYQEAMDTPLTDFTADDRLLQTITFYDGLGRTMQQVSMDQSPNKHDILSYAEYDAYGRAEKEYLPFVEDTGTMGNFRTDGAGKTTTHYNTAKYGNTTNPYTQKQFEASPLNRVEIQAAPGADWALGGGHEIEFGYRTNTAADAIKEFEVSLSLANNTHTPTLGIRATNGGLYDAGALYRTVTKDENHDGSSSKLHTTEEFTDKQGQVVLKRSYALVSSTETAHDTYYVYDDHGNLSYVLPPKMEAGTATLATLQSQMNDLGYQYVYDHRDRLVEKRIPGKGWEYIVYNSLDQPIMIQDAIQYNKSPKEWLFTKYDAFGRVAYTGKATDNRARTAIQNEVDGLSGNPWVVRSATSVNFGGADVYYDNGAYPTGSTGTTLTEVLTINYYDTYVDRPSGAPTSVSLFGASSGTNSTAVKGLPTVSRVKVLGVSPAKWIHTLSYYDAKARPIYAYTDNGYLGTVDIVESQLDFVGRPVKTRTKHTKGGLTIATLDQFTYDHAGRLLAQTQCIGDGTMGDSCPDSGATADLSLNQVISASADEEATNSITLNPGFHVVAGSNLSFSATIVSPGGEELIVYNSYDELGRLENKKVGGTVSGILANSPGLQTVDYTYNVRGWLKQINDPASLGTDLFAFDINYNTADHGGTALYNGNISETEWKTANDNVLRWYAYGYDALNRITDATANSSNYNVSGISYDKMGNILTLERQGHTNSGATTFGTMDDLTYTYDSGNKLMKVADAAPIDAFGFKDDAVNTAADTTDDYTYDSNGNMLTDTNKGITSITYNHLNLPTQVTLGSGNIQYIYDAAGVKQKKIVSGGGATTEYAGNFVYENSSLIFFNHPEGYIEPNGSNWDYIYQYKDHLGNIRLAYSDDNGNGSIATSEIREENNYYPFGLKHKGYNGSQSAARNHKYGFTGKEEQDELGLGWVDITARNYDPALGRWMNLDPLAEQMRRHSPYNYAFDNPISFIDPDGMAPRWYGQTSNEAADYANTVNVDYEARQSIYDSVNSALQDDGEDDDCCGYKEYFANRAEEVQQVLNVLNPVNAAKNGVVDGGKNIFRDVESQIKNKLANPFEAMKNAFEEGGGLLGMTGPVRIFQILKGSFDIGFNSATKLLNGDPYSAGYNVGSYYTGAAIGSAALFGLNYGNIPVYRIYGGSSLRGGDYYSFVNPRLVPNYNKFIGLPPGNTGAFMLRGNVRIRDIFFYGRVRPAARIGNNIGGFPELKIPSKYVDPLNIRGRFNYDFRK